MSEPRSFLKNAKNLFKILVEAARRHKYFVIQYGDRNKEDKGEIKEQDQEESMISNARPDNQLGPGGQRRRHGSQPVDTLLSGQKSQDREFEYEVQQDDFRE